MGTYQGTSGNDNNQDWLANHLNQANTIRGYGGNDILTGGNSRDTIYGGSGIDILSGGSGNDSLYGGIGHDILYGQNGSDRLHGYHGHDALYGGAGNDALYGGYGNDALYGEDGNDTIHGGPGPDTIDGGPGADLIIDSDSTSTLSSTNTLSSSSTNTLFFSPLDDDSATYTDKLIGGQGPDTFAIISDSDPILGTDNIQSENPYLGNPGNLQMIGLGGLILGESQPLDTRSYHFEDFDITEGDKIILPQDNYTVQAITEVIGETIKSGIGIYNNNDFSAPVAFLETDNIGQALNFSLQMQFTNVSNYYQVLGGDI